MKLTVLAAYIAQASQIRSCWSIFTVYTGLSILELPANIQGASVPPDRSYDPSNSWIIFGERFALSDSGVEPLSSTEDWYVR